MPSQSSSSRHGGGALTTYDTNRVNKTHAERVRHGAHVPEMFAHVNDCHFASFSI